MSTEMGTADWTSWKDAIRAGVDAVGDDLLADIARWLARASIVVIAGNGGSSTLASHMAQAIAKPSYGPEGGRAAVCLTDHGAAFTAHANDGGWEGALAASAAPYLAIHRAVLVVFSSSGRSKNIVRLVEEARRLDVPVVAFTGFTGGPVRQAATFSVHVDSDDYEVVEPVHDALLHRIQFHFRQITTAAERV